MPSLPKRGPKGPPTSARERWLNLLPYLIAAFFVLVVLAALVRAATQREDVPVPGSGTAAGLQPCEDIQGSEEAVTCRYGDVRVSLANAEAEKGGPTVEVDEVRARLLSGRTVQRPDGSAEVALNLEVSTDGEGNRRFNADRDQAVLVVTDKRLRAQTGVEGEGRFTVRPTAPTSGRLRFVVPASVVEGLDEDGTTASLELRPFDGKGSSELALIRLPILAASGEGAQGSSTSTSTTGSTSTSTTPDETSTSTSTTPSTSTTASP